MKRRAFIQIELIETLLIVAAMLIGSTGYYIKCHQNYNEVRFIAESKDMVKGLDDTLALVGSSIFKTALNTNGYTGNTYSTVPSEGYNSMKFGTKYHWFKKAPNVSVARLAAVTCVNGATGYELTLTTSTLPTNKKSFYYKKCRYSSSGLFQTNQSTLL